MPRKTHSSSQLVLDAFKGNISKDVIHEAYKHLKVRANSKQADMLLYKSIGIRFVQYKNNYPELLAWTYENSLYSKKTDVFGNTIRKIIDERYGV